MPPKQNQQELENGFRIDDAFLNRNLYIPPIVDKKKKEQVILNTNFLPHFQHSVKKYLTPEEKAALQDHQFQTFIIEISLSEVQLYDISELRAYVLNHIRSCPSYWLQNSSIQKSAQIRHQAFLVKQQKLEQWKKENPNRNVDSFSETQSNDADNVDQIVKDQEQEQQKEDKNRVIQAIAIYNKYQEDVNQLKKKYLYVKNCEYPEEVQINKYEKKENDQEEIDLLEEKLKKIRPNLNFNQGYYDNTTDQYQKQYKNSYSQYQSNSQRASDENVSQQTYFSHLRMKNILVPDRFFKNPKLDFFLFPMIYQFILHKLTNMKGVVINDEKSFRLQNFIFQLFLSEKQTLLNQKRTRGRKGYFTEIEKKDSAIEFEKEDKQILNKKDKNISNDQESEDQNNDDEDDDDNSIQNNDDKQSPSHSSSLSDKKTQNIKQRSQQKTDFLQGFSKYCEQKFGFNIQNYYTSSFVETSKKEKMLLFNSIKLGIDFYLFISKPENELLVQEENQQTEVEDLSNLNDKNSSLKKQLGKRKATVKNKNNLSLILDTMDNQDYYTLKVNELIIYYIKNYENFIDNYKVQLKEYLTLNKQVKNRQVIGSFSTQEEIDRSIKEYQEYLQNPDTLKVRGYLYHSDSRVKWTEEEYKKFLRLYLKYMKYPVNNRKIANDMGNNIHQNHVRFEKQPYMLGLRKRAEQNKIPLSEQVQRDIDNFSLSYFQRGNKQVSNSDGSPSGEDQSDNLNELDVENDEINEMEEEDEEDEEDEEEDDDEEEDEDKDNEIEDGNVENDDSDEEEDDDEDEDDEDDDDDSEQDQDDDESDSNDSEENKQQDNIQKDQGNKNKKNSLLKQDEKVQVQNNEKQDQNKKQTNKKKQQNKKKSIQKDNYMIEEDGQQNKNKKKKNLSQMQNSQNQIQSQNSFQNQKLSTSDDEINLSDCGSELKSEDLDEQSEQLDNDEKDYFNMNTKTKNKTNQPKLNSKISSKENDELKINFSDEDDYDFGESSYKRKKIKQSVKNKSDDYDEDDSISF